MKKVTKLIGLLSLIILSFGQLRAEDSYVKMIHEDRVWEYQTIAMVLRDTLYYTTYKFDGTITCNDKTYHAFTNTNFKKCIREYEGDNYKEFLVSDIDLNGEGEKYFLREEDGKVYVLVEVMEYGSVYPYFTDEKLLDISFSADANMSERVLYDSSLDNGALVDINPRFGFLEEIEDTDDIFEWKFSQFYGEKIEIDDQQCRCFEYYFSHEDMLPTKGQVSVPYPVIHFDRENCWIEGIGIIERGILSNFCVPRIASSAPEKSKGISNYYLNHTDLRSVYTTDGRVLYGDEPYGSGVERTEADILTIGTSDGAVVARGAGSIDVTVCGLDGTAVASASGRDEVRIPTAEIGRGLYIVSASDGTSTRTLKLRL